MNKVQILVLDFGSQYTQLIARRLRESGVYTEIVPYFEKIEDIKAREPKGIILSGGPASVYEEGAYKPDEGVFELGVPVLGICYGMQYIADFFGGSVIRAEAQEFGKAELEIIKPMDMQENQSFLPSKDKEQVFAKWKNSFFGAHGFMSKGMLDEIATTLKERIDTTSNFCVKTDDNNQSLAFGIYEIKDGVCEFECHIIDRNLSQKQITIDFLAQLEHMGATSFITQWDKYDKSGLKDFIELGFEPDSSFENMVTLKAQAKDLNLSEKTNHNDANNHIFKNIKQNSIVWMSHADKVEEIPEGFVELAKSGNTHYCAIAHLQRRIYALQFHPEVVHSQCGGKMLENFAVGICGAKTDWNMHNFAENEIAKLREIAKEGKVLCAVSGGVDSSVVATLLYRAIGDRVIPVFVDHGLLRAGEREAVEAMFRENLGVPLISVDAREIFLGKLRGVRDPEEKRKIIGETFIEVFEAEARKHNSDGEIRFLAQGTLYPDVIESVSIKGPSKTIKSHHNVGGLPEWMKFELIEPLRELFKDEVRALGRELGMPESMLMRHPFPGPGLAIRIMGEVNEEDLELLRKADRIFLQELHTSGYYDKVWQAFCVLLNVKSVGVMGDNRTYDNTICVRAVEALDGMTATFAHLPHDLLERISNRIINEVQGINRVVYDITSKPPGTIEWE